MKRYAIVRNARDRSEAEAYLPDNYKVIGELIEREGQVPYGCTANGTEQLVFVIAGEDVAGWTLDGFVRPRYASGLIQTEEIDLSHPIMKQVPA